MASTTRVTNKEILQALTEIEKRTPNGELLLIKNAIENLQEGQDELKTDLRDIKKQLLDPDRGVVVRVNKNTEDRRYWENRKTEIEDAFDNMKSLLSWKGGVNKALWIVYTIMIGIFIKFIIFGV